MSSEPSRRAPALPWPAATLVAGALVAQWTWSGLQPPPRAQAEALPAAPPAATLRLFALGEPALAARVALLWLQAWDYQPGVSLSYRELDYDVLADWLARMLELDPTFQGPLLAAARLYGDVDDPDRQRRMIAFVAEAFAADPARRWPWLAHAVYLARHRLHDAPRALELAHMLADADPRVPIPHWARQMEIFVRADMGDVEGAKVLLGALLESGEIRDPHEHALLMQRLAELEARASQK